jgi:hypothetical protein
MIRVHFAISACTNFWNSAGELPTGVAPSWIARSRIAGSAIAFPVSALTCSTIALGVPAGASRPNQPIAS